MISRTASLCRRSLPTAAATAQRAMSASAKVWVDKNTRVICQGFTGKQVCCMLVVIVACYYLLLSCVVGCGRALKGSPTDDARLSVTRRVVVCVCGVLFGVSC
jgi:hypothetical protein